MAMKPIRISQLNSYIKRLLQSDPLLGNVSVIGEISNLKHHGTGHVYFTLKDESSKINCFLNSDTLKDIRFELADGLEIIADGYIYLYERGGTYSLNIRDIRVEGMGNLSIAFEKLKEKLAAEGLFDEKYKKPIPMFPQNIGVITSETGAAVRDIITIIKGRNDVVNVTVFPVLVQGPGAAADIAETIRLVNQQFPHFDTLIVGRGGGSKEELWAFNEEIVARSIFDSVIPVISAVGHEIDFSISDFVADKRAETPTAAAQMAVPDTRELRTALGQYRESLERRLDNQLRMLDLKLRPLSPEQSATVLLHRIQRERMGCDNRLKELEQHVITAIRTGENRINSIREQLEALNPLKIMERGYAAILDGQGILRSSASDFTKDDPLTARFRDGKVDCIVVESSGEIKWQ